MAAVIPTNGLGLASGLAITDGDLTFASGHGISFAADAHGGGMASELLDDYEEGDHVITTHYAGSGSWSTKDSADTLQYTKIGRLVHISGRVDVDTYSSASGIGYVDTPFTASAGSENSGILDTNFLC